MTTLTPITSDTHKTETAQSIRAGWGGETRQNQLYKPFLRGALVTVLTIGCTLGALNLAVMGFGADLGAVWTPLIQSHGYAQVFGWVGLFIMGIAYHLVPRFYLRPLQRPRVVLLSFGLTLVGLAVRFLAQPFASDYAPASWLLVISALLALAGMTLFVGAMYGTMRHGSDRGGSLASKLYIGAGFGWLWVGQVCTAGLMLYLALRQQNAIPAALDAPYLRALLSGAVVTTILGFTLRTVPHLVGLKPVPNKAMLAIFAIYTTAVLVQIGADIWPTGAAGSWPGVPPVVWALGAASELLALTVFATVSGVFNLSALRTTQPAKKNPWPERFVRTAYGWLLVAAGLNFAFGLSALVGTGVPHAFVASYHHALTVGFISMMILGMSMRLVPAFIGAMNKRPGLAALVFTLVNLGCGLRVMSESLAFAYGGVFYTVMGLSGLVEVAGLAVYGVALWKALDEPSYGQAAAAGRGAALVLSTRARERPATQEGRKVHG